LSDSISEKSAKKKQKKLIYRISLWIVGIACLLIFSLVVDIPAIIFLASLVALLSREWILAMAITFIRGTAIFGIMDDIQMLWITVFLLYVFIWGIYTFFFNTDKFIKPKRS
jgi:hypothetical protein